jgi:alkylhydroperoxidase family enzyme
MITLLPVEEAKKRARASGVEDRFVQSHAFRTLLHSPRAAAAISNLLKTLMFENTLNTRLRELVIMRTGWRTRSEYEFAQHARLSRELKISEEDILGVREPEKCTSYNELDRAVLRMTDELIDNADVTSQTWAVLQQSLSEAELVELLLTAGVWRGMAGYLKAARLTLDEGLPGWPGGQAPA